MVNGGRIRPLVPIGLRKAVFNSVHRLAHPGMRATVRMVIPRYVRLGCSAEVAGWVRDCLGCATGKPGHMEAAQVISMSVLFSRFSQVHVDIVGPLPSSPHGHSHLLTMLDCTTRWPEVVPLPNITAQAVLDAFLTALVAFLVYQSW